jgi:hypothetical protein
MVLQGTHLVGLLPLQEGDTALCVAAKNGHVEVASRLLAAGALANVTKAVSVFEPTFPVTKAELNALGVARLASTCTGGVAVAKATKQYECCCLVGWLQIHDC